MKKRLTSLLAALFAAAVLLPLAAAPVSAHPSAEYDPAYNDTCYNGWSSAEMAAGNHSPDSRGFNIVRTSQALGFPDGAGSRILLARAKFTARALWPCIEGDDTHPTKSLVLASLQSDEALDGAKNLVQAGIGKVHYTYGWDDACTGVDGTLNDQTMFMYTPDPVGAPGYLCRAGFVDLDNNGTPDSPIGGRTYWIWVFYYDSGSSNYFRVCFEDLVTYSIDCKNVPRTARDGGSTGNNAAWWAFEAGNDSNSWTPSSYSKFVMAEMQYQKATNLNLYWTETSTRHTPWGPNPSWWACSADQAGVGEKWWCYSTSH